ncbi:MAG: hypothetical protein P8Y71_09320 [Pseudolabrys sp.]
MRRTVSNSLAPALAGALAFSTSAPSRVQAAATKKPQIAGKSTVEFSARRRHHGAGHYHGNSRAALRAFGIIAGTIANIAAAERARRDCRDYGYRYGYYGYRPHYYYPCPRHYYYRYRYYRPYYFYFRY